MIAWLRWCMSNWLREKAREIRREYPGPSSPGTHTSVVHKFCDNLCTLADQVKGADR